MAELSGNVTAGVTPSGEMFTDWTIGSLSSNQILSFFKLGNSDPITLPISSWQATSRAGTSQSYLQVVVPAAEDVLAEITARNLEYMEISVGVRVGGQVRSEVLLRAPFQNLTTSFGPVNKTATLSGYGYLGYIPSGAERTLNNIRSITTTNGKRKVRCDIDLFLRPNMYANANGDVFLVGSINYYVNQNQNIIEVGQR